MTIYFYEGPAGSGKTTSLIQQLQEHIQTTPLNEGEQVLGLAVMHGARHRLVEKLSEIPALNRRFHCSTFDSFAWRIVNRWRALLTSIGEPLNNEPGTSVYETTCNSAAVLLSYQEVRDWVSRAFPIVVVDEAQDCLQGRLQILKYLSHSCVLLVAADEYQDLQGSQMNEAVSWLRSTQQKTLLTYIHRTQVKGLLAAASSLREGAGFPSSSSCKLIGAWNAGNAASYIAHGFYWNGYKNAVILTPSKSPRALFVHETIDWLRSKSINKVGKNLGPFPIDWEPEVGGMSDELKKVIGLPENPTELVHFPSLNLMGSTPGIIELRVWIEEKQSLSGLEYCQVAEIEQRITAICQRIRSYRRSNFFGIRAMTIHQAKNQEFDGVAVLWPYAVGKDIETNRRLLYNAVTRAKRWCLVVVQNQKRLKDEPFTSREDC